MMLSSFVSTQFDSQLHNKMYLIDLKIVTLTQESCPDRAEMVGVSLVTVGKSSKGERIVSLFALAIICEEGGCTGSGFPWFGRR